MVLCVSSFPLHPVLAGKNAKQFGNELTTELGCPQVNYSLLAYSAPYRALTYIYMYRNRTLECMYLFIYLHFPGR